jgi:hypothetical protein
MERCVVPVFIHLNVLQCEVAHSKVRKSKFVTTLKNAGSGPVKCTRIPIFLRGRRKRVTLSFFWKNYFLIYGLEFGSRKVQFEECFSEKSWSSHLIYIEKLLVSTNYIPSYGISNFRHEDKKIRKSNSTYWSIKSFRYLFVHTFNEDGTNFQILHLRCQK